MSYFIVLEERRRSLINYVVTIDAIEYNRIICERTSVKIAMQSQLSTDTDIGLL